MIQVSSDPMSLPNDECLSESDLFHINWTSGSVTENTLMLDISMVTCFSFLKSGLEQNGFYRDWALMLSWSTKLIETFV